MASLRKAKCYRNIVRAYTRRSKVRGKDFIKAVPNSKIVTFNMGELKGAFTHKVYFIAKTDHQIRHNALESTRQIINRHLIDEVGAKGYFFQILAYPHHVLRENKMLTGAGADRMSTGMSHPFGRAVGLAAQVKKGKKVFVVKVNEQNIDKAKKVLHLAFSRLPSKYIIQSEKNN
ncbi:MAG TPA: 50S ribosomal protein L16 [Candidatus Nanoarchaeia archaeon]|nr:50S ribosomal protein L16 [Candidatus Nanoarchaeia archaeon]